MADKIFNEHSLKTWWACIVSIRATSSGDPQFPEWWRPRVSLAVHPALRPKCGRDAGEISFAICQLLFYTTNECLFTVRCRPGGNKEKFKFKFYWALNAESAGEENYHRAILVRAAGQSSRIRLTALAPLPPCPLHCSSYCSGGAGEAEWKLLGLDNNFNIYCSALHDN